MFFKHISPPFQNFTIPHWHRQFHSLLAIPCFHVTSESWNLGVYWIIPASARAHIVGPFRSDCDFKSHLSSHQTLHFLSLNYINSPCLKRLLHTYLSPNTLVIPLFFTFSWIYIVYIVTHININVTCGSRCVWHVSQEYFPHSKYTNTIQCCLLGSPEIAASRRRNG